MKKTEIRKKVNSCVQQMFKGMEIKSNTRFVEDLNMSFIDMLVLGNKFEEEFDAKFDKDDLERMYECSVGELIDYIYDFMKPFKE